MELTTTSYRVWVQVEQIDLAENGETVCDDIGRPDCLGEFDTFEQATAHIRSLPSWEFDPASDYRGEEEKDS